MRQHLVALVSSCSILAVGAMMNLDGKNHHGNRFGMRPRAIEHRKEQEIYWNDDDDEVTPIVSFSKPSCKNFMKKGCRPSAMPSSPPTFSTGPTISSSPSAEPTDMLSAVPTVESFSPSSFPTSKPSAYPTRAPSTVPRTSSPSRTPSLLPTFAPTDAPTPKPTASPSRGLTDTPTDVPNLDPTSRPTSLQTLTPTNRPSDEPTTFVQTANGADGVSSACSIPPNRPGSTKPQLVAFQYNMYIANLANEVEKALVLETRLHEGLVDEFLSCSFDRNMDGFHIISISSNPSDTVTQELCSTENDPVPAIPTKCFVVTAELSMTAFFPDQSRNLQQTVADVVVLDSLASYLNSSMADGDFIGDDIVQVSFQGFLNLQTDGDTASTGNDANGIEGLIGGSKGGEGSDILVGSAAVGGAALLLLLVTILSVRKSRNNQLSYMKHFDDLASAGSSAERSFGDERSFDSKMLADGRVMLFRHDDDFEDFFSLDEEIVRELPAAHPDVHYCSSATCPICKHRVMGPTFLSTSLSEDDTSDLSPRKYISSQDDRHYIAPDTVIL